MKYMILALMLAHTIQTTQANNFALEAPYPHTIPTLVERSDKKSSVSDMTTMLSYQSAVKNQGYRGTCSIFSSLAIVESLMIRDHQADTSIDLSEQYLSFLTQAYRQSETEGSWASYNWFLIKRYGVPTEEELPYNPEPLSINSELGKSRCGELVNRGQKICLTAQYNPNFLNLGSEFIADEEFLAGRIGALEFIKEVVAGYMLPTNAGMSPQYRVIGTNAIRRSLDQMTPLALELDVHYGAWNHGAGESFGIEMNDEEWAQGIVTYAEPGSVDLVESRKNRAGHSVVVVGYDDNKIITKTHKMVDGTEKTVSYRGVYYFKNSWGTTSFGRDFTYEGVSYPGYGMITYKYAHELGSFFRLPLISNP